MSLSIALGTKDYIFSNVPTNSSKSKRDYVDAFTSVAANNPEPKGTVHARDLLVVTLSIALSKKGLKIKLFQMSLPVAIHEEGTSRAHLKVPLSIVI